jgi:pimeloyl-ACP methyl ester carboxylesterase
MLSAQKDGNIRALVLIAGPGTTGADLILEQQQYALGRLKLSDADRQAKVDLQKKIQAAVVSGQGWDAIPADLRRGADTPWFSSLLQFDPAKAMEKVKQPILIVQGDLDRQVPAHHADKLAALAKARKKAPDVQVSHFPSLNHLLMPANTGDVDEYPALEPKSISTDVPQRIVTWLAATMTAKT